MDVHAHSHTERKKWTHYLWEFLMLFLAVFCGFLAENQREHYIENQRERQYAAQLYEDLKFDTLAFSEMSRVMQHHLQQYDSVSLLFQNQAVFTDDEFVRIARSLLSYYNPFNISTAFQQMKSSGTLRYIHNADLRNLISDYYDTHIPRLLTLFEYINEKVHTQIEPFFAEHFDLTVTQYYFNTNNDQQLPPNLKYYNRTESSDLLIKNYFKMYYNGVHFICYDPLRYINGRAIDLIKELRKEYHLK